ncbi:MAG: ATP-binding protein [Sulfitobacter sp.]
MFFDWLKRYVPRGIYPRAALILMLPVVALQLVVTVLFAQRHFEGVTHQMTDTVGREIALIMERANGAPDPQSVPETVRRALGPLDIPTHVVQSVPHDPGFIWYDFSGRVLHSRLADMLPGFLQADLSDSDKVVIYVQGALGPVAMQIPRKLMTAKNPHQLFVYTLFFGVVLTGIATIYLRNQLRPIRRLARAAQAFGRGRHMPYVPAGATEVRAAGSAFVDMRQRIERHIEQRTLMLSGVSHDLRTPLTRMRLSLALLDDEEAGPLLEDVDDMQRMLDEFLSFAKGTAEMAPEPLKPAELVADIVHDAQRAGRDVTLLPIEGDSDAVVQLREVAMRRAVDNLISNAVRYGARAQVTVMISDKALRIRIEDDGPGIPADQRAEALRPFTRLDRSRNQNKGGGVGLGLAIATDIARAHGGVLRLGEAENLGGLQADIVIAR